MLMNAHNANDALGSTHVTRDCRWTRTNPRQSKCINNPFQPANSTTTSSKKKTKKKPKKQQLTSRKLSKTNLTLIILVNKRALGIIVSWQNRKNERKSWGRRLWLTESFVSGFPELKSQLSYFISMWLWMYHFSKSQLFCSVKWRQQ